MSLIEPCFKYQRLRDEFYNQARTRVRETVFALAEYAYHEYSYHIVITSVIRQNSWMHQNGYAIDVRANDMPRDCVGNCIIYVLTSFPRFDIVPLNGHTERTALSCFAHGKGVNFHLHISQDVDKK